MELELAGGAPLAGGGEREAADGRAEPVGARLADRRPHRVERLRRPPATRVADGRRRRASCPCRPTLPAREARRLRARCPGRAASSRSSSSSIAAQPLGVGGDLVEARAEQVVAVAAVAPLGAHRVELRRAPAPARRPTAGGSAAVSGTRSSTRSQLASNAAARASRASAPHAGGEQEQERALERRVGEQLLAERAPPPLVLDAGADLVEHLDARREAGLDRVLGQDPLGERVQRADGGAVELVERRAAAARRRRGRPPPARSCRARRTRSRSSAPAFSVNVMAAIAASSTAPLGDEGDDAVDEGGGLARAGAGLDEQRLVERVDDAVAGGLVGQDAASVTGQLLDLGLGARRAVRRGRRTGPAPGRPLALPGPAQLGDAEAVGIAGRALDPRRRADRGGVGREDAGLDAGDDRVERACRPGRARRR